MFIFASEQPRCGSRLIFSANQLADDADDVLRGIVVRITHCSFRNDGTAHVSGRGIEEVSLQHVSEQSSYPGFCSPRGVQEVYSEASERGGRNGQHRAEWLLGLLCRDVKVFQSSEEDRVRAEESNSWEDVVSEENLSSSSPEMYLVHMGDGTWRAWLCAIHTRQNPASSYQLSPPHRKLTRRVCTTLISPPPPVRHSSTPRSDSWCGCGMKVGMCLGEGGERDLSGGGRESGVRGETERRSRGAEGGRGKKSCWMGGREVEGVRGERRDGDGDREGHREAEGRKVVGWEEERWRGHGDLRERGGFDA
eukprot:751264-Hanusia_phi.AAC.2